MRNLTDELNEVSTLWRMENPPVLPVDAWDEWDLAPFVDWVARKYQLEKDVSQYFTEQMTDRFTEEQLLEMYLKWQLEKEE